MTDLKNPGLICAKGFLFLLCGVLSCVLLVAQTPRWQTVLLLSISVWGFCRFYYFAFYVIQHYVDDQYTYAGLWDFARYGVIRKPMDAAETAGGNGELTSKT